MLWPAKAGGTTSGPSSCMTGRRAVLIPQEAIMAIGFLGLAVVGLLGLGIFIAAIVLVVWAIAYNRKP